MLNLKKTPDASQDNQQPGTSRNAVEQDPDAYSEEIWNLYSKSVRFALKNSQRRIQENPITPIVREHQELLDQKEALMNRIYWLYSRRAHANEFREPIDFQKRLSHWWHYAGSGRPYYVDPYDDVIGPVEAQLAEVNERLKKLFPELQEEGFNEWLRKLKSEVDKANRRVEAKKENAENKSYPYIDDPETLLNTIENSKPRTIQGYNENIRINHQRQQKLIKELNNGTHLSEEEKAEDAESNLRYAKSAYIQAKMDAVGNGNAHDFRLRELLLCLAHAGSGGAALAAAFSALERLAPDRLDTAIANPVPAGGQQAADAALRSNATGTIGRGSGRGRKDDVRWESLRPVIRDITGTQASGDGRTKRESMPLVALSTATGVVAGRALLMEHAGNQVGTTARAGEGTLGIVRRNPMRALAGATATVVGGLLLYLFSRNEISRSQTSEGDDETPSDEEGLSSNSLTPNTSPGISQRPTTLQPQEAETTAAATLLRETSDYYDSPQADAPFAPLLTRGKINYKVVDGSNQYENNSVVTVTEGSERVRVGYLYSNSELTIKFTNPNPESGIDIFESNLVLTRIAGKKDTGKMQMISYEDLEKKIVLNIISNSEGAHIATGVEHQIFELSQSGAGPSWIDEQTPGFGTHVVHKNQKINLAKTSSRYPVRLWFPHLPEGIGNRAVNTEYYEEILVKKITYHQEDDNAAVDFLNSLDEVRLTYIGDRKTVETLGNTMEMVDCVISRRRTLPQLADPFYVSSDAELIIAKQFSETKRNIAFQFDEHSSENIKLGSLVGPDGETCKFREVQELVIGDRFHMAYTSDSFASFLISCHSKKQLERIRNKLRHDIHATGDRLFYVNKKNSELENQILMGKTQIATSRDVPATLKLPLHPPGYTIESRNERDYFLVSRKLHGRYSIKCKKLEKRFLNETPSDMRVVDVAGVHVMNSVQSDLVIEKEWRDASGGHIVYVSRDRKSTLSIDEENAKGGVIDRTKNQIGKMEASAYKAYGLEIDAFLAEEFTTHPDVKNFHVMGNFSRPLFITSTNFDDEFGFTTPLTHDVVIFPVEETGKAPARDFGVSSASWLVEIESEPDLIRAGTVSTFRDYSTDRKLTIFAPRSMSENCVTQLTSIIKDQMSKREDEYRQTLRTLSQKKSNSVYLIHYWNLTPSWAQGRAEKILSKIKKRDITFENALRSSEGLDIAHDLVAYGMRVFRSGVSPERYGEINWSEALDSVQRDGPEEAYFEKLISQVKKNQENREQVTAYYKYLYIRLVPRQISDSDDLAKQANYAEAMAFVVLIEHMNGQSTEPIPAYLPQYENMLQPYRGKIPKSPATILRVLNSARASNLYESSEARQKVLNELLAPGLPEPKIPKTTPDTRPKVMKIPESEIAKVGDGGQLGVLVMAVGATIMFVGSMTVAALGKLTTLVGGLVTSIGGVITAVVAPTAINLFGTAAMEQVTLSYLVDYLNEFEPVDAEVLKRSSILELGGCGVLILIGLDATGDTIKEAIQNPSTKAKLEAIGTTMAEIGAIAGCAVPVDTAIYRFYSVENYLEHANSIGVAGAGVAATGGVVVYAGSGMDDEDDKTTRRSYWKKAPDAPSPFETFLGYWTHPNGQIFTRHKDKKEKATT